MAIQANTLPPSLVNDLADIKRRLNNLERAPAPVNKFDRYPAVEWEPIPRGVVEGNQWHSTSVADVTGLVFDRIETRFATYDVIKGKREPEIRLIACRVLRGGYKQILSASQSWRLRGDVESYLAFGVIRWIHQIPFGWEYASDVDVYTIEFQVRYAVGPETSGLGAGDTGNAKISAMQYCVGLPEDRVPGASTEGLCGYLLEVVPARPASITEPVFLT